MMETNTSQDDPVNESDASNITIKKACLSNGRDDQDMVQEHTSDETLPNAILPENGLACNGVEDMEDVISDDKVHSDNEGGAVHNDKDNGAHNKSDYKENVSVKENSEPNPSQDDSDVVLVGDEEKQTDENICDTKNNDCVDTKKNEDHSNSGARSQNHVAVENETDSEKNKKELDLNVSIESQDSEDVKCLDDVIGDTTDNINVNNKKKAVDKHSESGNVVDLTADTADNAKSNIKNEPKNKTRIMPNRGMSKKDNTNFVTKETVAPVRANKSQRSPQVANSGHSLKVAGPRIPTKSPIIRNVIPPPAFSPGFMPNRGPRGAPLGFVGTPNTPPVSQGSPGVSMYVPPVAPPKPKSSLDQIELIRWEIQNRINTRPKYFKPCPSSELGTLAKFLFDIGSDLIKEAVYHDLVKIQSKKNTNNLLNDKEKEDLSKLKKIEKDLFATIGHLKFKLKKKCQVCHFQTESNNVMFFHKQYPHEDNKLIRCANCSFVTKQVMAFKSHMESHHNMQPKLHDKKGIFECDLCPYENNQEQKLNLHKERCLKQFRPFFNLHPSCLSGAEINLCLENIFYKPVYPKNLKLLQHRHALQQAAIAEAKKQQAELQALAIAKKASAASAKVQKQIASNRMATPNANRMHTPNANRMHTPNANRMHTPHANRMPTPNANRMPTPNIPFNSPSGQMVRQPIRNNTRTPRPTVANILNNKQNALALPTAPPNKAAPGGFEVCEICGGYVKDRKALRIHFFYAHRIDLPLNLFERAQAPLYCATCYVRFWTAQGLRKHIDSHKEENQTRGVVGKCISCGHHVLNLVLHMRAVHNRELQHYVNALVCMFCGSHFGTQQETEYHITSVHGHVDSMTGTLKSSANAPVQHQVQQKTPPVQGNQKKTANNNLVKGSVCVLCNLNFGRNVDLTRHCMRMHHTCMKCGMVVIDHASLMKHTCLTSPSGTRNCSLCAETGFHPAYYVKHLRDKHLKKFSISLFRLSRQIIEQWTTVDSQSEHSAEEISDNDEDVAIDHVKPPAQNSTTKKRPIIGPACKTGRSRINPPSVAVQDVTTEEKMDTEDVEKNDDKKEDLEVNSADLDCEEAASPRGDKRQLPSSSEETEDDAKRQKLS